MKKLLIALVSISVLAAIVLPNKPSTAPATSTDPSAANAAAKPAPTAPVLSKKERDDLIAKATKSFKVDRDKMESVTFYTPRGAKIGSTSLDAYLSIPDGHGAIFRIVARYSGDDWVFYERIKVMADDQVVYEKEFPYRDVVRDNSSGTVWETVDYAASPADIAALAKISEAKSATVRFSGRERRRDHTLSNGDLERLKSSLKAYKELSPLKT